MNNEITMDSETKLLDYTYRNIRFCIKSETYCETYNYDQEIWEPRPRRFLALYLYLRRENCVDFDSLKVYEVGIGSRNSKYGILDKIPFHWGITFFEKYDNDGLLKIGCDYNHLGDDPMSIPLDYVKRDGMRAIDAIWEWELGILNIEGKK